MEAELANRVDNPEAEQVLVGASGKPATRLPHNFYYFPWTERTKHSRLLSDIDRNGEETMPPDLQHDAQRKLGRKGADEGEGSHSREIELKRSKGEISCAECRRLKIKCDKKLPCSSCQRRGCASLCPNGSLATGQGTRFVLAATDHLHRRISKMSERIRQLEDALSVLQSSVSRDPHPLLRDELLSLKVEKKEEGVDPEEGQEKERVIDAFGTLSITDRGSSRFFGAAGGTEILLGINDDEDWEGGDSPPYRNSPASTSVKSDSNSPKLPPELTLFSNSFPFTPIGPTHAVKLQIESYLPPWERACILADTYLEQAAWLFRAVSKQQLIDEMLPIIYKRQAPLDASHEYNGPHDLSLLYMIFAVGALVDLNLEPFNKEADHYYQLAKAAVALQNVFEKPELVTIQALHLMSIYNAMHQPDDRQEEAETSMEMSWSLIRVCHQLAQTLGLHRDSARWGLAPREVQRRRSVFWDLFIADSWQSLSTGRPPSITLPYIDCHFPLDDEMRLNDKGEAEPGFGSWGFRFACECVGQVAEKTLTAAIPSYATILDLDAKVREFPIPEFPKDLPMDPRKPSDVMARYALSHSREIILLSLHRSFFAQAMMDDPVNPLRSQYAPSFLASYRCASHILKTIREEFDILPELCARFWSTWTFAFSSAVVFGSIVTRGPSSNMAPSALAELDAAVELFKKASIHSKRAAKALTILQKLQNKARMAFDSALGSQSKAEPKLELKLGLASTEEKDDELAIFGGKTRLRSSKRGGSSNASSPPQMQGVTPTPPPQPPLVAPGYSPAMSRDMSTSSTSSLSHQDIGANADPGHGTLHNHTSSVYQGRNGHATAAWARSTAGDYHEHVTSERETGNYADPYLANVAEQGMRVPTIGHVGGQAMKYEWNTPEMVPNVAPPHQAHPHYGQASSYSHPVHPSQGMDGMEYGQPGVPPHYAPHQHSQHNAHHYPQHGQPEPNTYAVYNHPQSTTEQIPHYQTYSGGMPPGVNGAGVPYAPAPRELAEMGLASQHSGLNQRWTSFMHDSGLFYSSDSSN